MQSCEVQFRIQCIQQFVAESAAQPRLVKHLAGATHACDAQKVHIIFAASPCSLASDCFRKTIIKTLHGTLCHMARSIAGTCLWARARGNEQVLYAIWQEVLRAHAFWQGLEAMRKYFMPYGKKYCGHMPLWQGLE